MVPFAQSVALLTAEEFVAMPEDGLPRELVDGRIEEATMPGLRHGQICSKIDRLVGAFVETNDRGHVMSNDSFILIKRDPDTVRGSDICYFSYERLPRGPVPESFADVAPELVFEVRSPSDRWVKIMLKMGEYLNAGVSVVCVVDPQAETVSIYRPDENCKTFTANDDFLLPDILPGFVVKVRKFFE